MPRFPTFRVLALAAALTLTAAVPVLGEIIPPVQPVVGGVALSTDGVIQNRDDDPNNTLTAMRRHWQNANTAEANLHQLKAISLPKIFAQAKALLAAGKPLPNDIKYLGGLTQIRYVFVYPDQHDLLIAGPAEEITDPDSAEPLGETTGRPVLHFFDLVVAMRTLRQDRHRDFFGCSIDFNVDSQKISDKIAAEYSNRPAAELIAAMSKAIGPQKVTIIGTADNTRFALALVAADYKLKRFCMGLEHTPVQGVGHAVENGKAGGSRFWFETDYDPLAVSADGNAYAITGPRLLVNAGPQVFQTTGVSDKAKRFAQLFSAKIPELAKVEPALADLQNIADLSLLAALIQHDRLNTKTQWDPSWCLDNNACPVPTIPVPKTTDTVVAVIGNSVACGGVAFSLSHLVAHDARITAKPNAIPNAPALPTDDKWQTELALSHANKATPSAITPSGAKP